VRYSTGGDTDKALAAIPGRPEALTVTRSGIVFDASKDVWKWTDGVFRVSLNFAALPEGVAHLKQELKAVLAGEARSCSPNTLSAAFVSFLHFGRVRTADRAGLPIEPIDLANYAAHLGPELAWRQARVKLTLVRMAALGMPGVDAQCVDYYEERRIPGGPKGHPVRTHDPHKGPFTEREYLGLYKALDSAFGQGDLPLWAMVLARLLFALGARVSQYSSLKLGDLTVEEGKHTLQLPQVKQRLEHSRSAFRSCQLTAQTAGLVQALIDQERALGGTSGSPLFSRATILPDRSEVPGPSDPRFAGHCTGSALSQVFKRWVQPLAPLTERLRYQQLPINTKRFRYTLGTRLAEEGASAYVIADCLGHADTQNVKCYVEASPKLIEALDRALGPALAPIAQAFRGRLVKHEDGSSQRGVAGSRIIDFRVSTAGVGSCGGQTNACSQLKPVACYTCFKFEPWLDAPHDKLLARLEADRVRFADDRRMASVNDDAIIAVREVMAQCAEVRNLRRGARA
jgi:integrase